MLIACFPLPASIEADLALCLKPPTQFQLPVKIDPLFPWKHLGEMKITHRGLSVAKGDTCAPCDITRGSFPED